MKTKILRVIFNIKIFHSLKLRNNNHYIYLCIKLYTFNNGPSKRLASLKWSYLRWTCKSFLNCVDSHMSRAETPVEIKSLHVSHLYKCYLSVSILKN